MGVLEEREREFIEALCALDDWMLQYEYLLSFVRGEHVLPDERRCASNVIRGCTADAWMELWRHDDGSMGIAVASDALIVAGLLGVIAALVDGVPCDEVARWVPTFIEQTALGRELSVDRRHGMDTVLERIVGFARSYRKTL